MSRTRRKKLPYLDDDSEFNSLVQRDNGSANIPLKDPDNEQDEVWGLLGKRNAKKSMAKKHRQDRRIDIRNRLRDFLNNKEEDNDN